MVSMEALDREGDLLTVAAGGYGKRTVIGEYRRQSRGGKGIINLKVSDKTGEVVAVNAGQARRRHGADYPGWKADSFECRRREPDRSRDPRA